MKPEYLKFIEDNCPTPGYARGNCRCLSGLMTEWFPELRQVNGLYHCPVLGKQPHWWCVDKDENVIDPTVHQFPSGIKGVVLPRRMAILMYEEASFTGLCPECGADTFNDAVYCSMSCLDKNTGGA
jgi:hypothetical protein